MTRPIPEITHRFSLGLNQLPLIRTHAPRRVAAKQTLVKSTWLPVVIAAAMVLSVSGCATLQIAPHSASLAAIDVSMASHGGSKRGSLEMLPSPQPAVAFETPLTVGKATVDLDSTSEQSETHEGAPNVALASTEVPDLTSPTSADVRVAELERQVQWFREDVARMQTLLTNFERDGVSTPEIEVVHRQQSLQQQVAALQQALSAAHRNDAAQQSTIDELSRHFDEMKATLAREREEETRALDGLIHQMEQLLQFQAEQAMRQRLTEGGGDAS